MSFFGEFKNSLKEDAGDLGGRYFAKVIGEILKENPWFLSLLYDGISKDIEIMYVETETSFCGKSGKHRRADLYIQYADKKKENKDKIQTLYIEIKWKDNAHKNQICDYIKNLNNKGNDKFLLLTLKNLDNGEEDLKLISKSENAQSLTCPDLYERIIKYIKKHSKHNNWLIQQFIQFLKENAMIYETKINKKALIRFMKNTIAWDHNDNFGKNLTQSTMDEYPTLLHTLLSNIHKISLEIYEEYLKENNEKPQKPYTDFFIQNNCNKYHEHQAGYFAVKHGATEGQFIIQSRFKTDKDNDNDKYLAYGIYFYFHKNKEKKYTIDLYTFANQHGAKTEKYNETKFKKFNITDLDKDDDKTEYIKFPKAEELLKDINSNIEKLKDL